MTIRPFTPPLPDSPRSGSKARSTRDHGARLRRSAVCAAPTHPGRGAWPVDVPSLDSCIDCRGARLRGGPLGSASGAYVNAIRSRNRLGKDACRSRLDTADLLRWRVGIGGSASTAAAVRLIRDIGGLIVPLRVDGVAGILFHTQHRAQGTGLLEPANDLRCAFSYFDACQVNSDARSAAVRTC